MLETKVVETRSQHAMVGVTQSPNANITITWVETVVAPIMDVVRRGVLIRSTTKLGSGSCGISTKRNLSWSSTLLTITYGVVGTP
jgi:hypothetical protein